MAEGRGYNGAVAFALIYFTFFLDNVLLTVLVPIAPDWLRGESLALWRAAGAAEAPLAAMLNRTVSRVPVDDAGVGGAQAEVGAVLGAKAAAQLCGAPVAAAAVSRVGPRVVLRGATALLAAAALALASCGRASSGSAALCVGSARLVHGSAAALSAVAGLALASSLPLPPSRRDSAVSALLGAVALGVLVGYPFGGASIALWSRSSPFLLLAAALLFDLALQMKFLDGEEICEGGWAPVQGLGLGAVRREARRGACGACAGAVALAGAVLGALEPGLPLWVARHGARGWAAGAVFVPDSAAYLAATTALGGAARAFGAERAAVCAQLCVALGALGVSLAQSVRGLVAPQLLLGLGWGALDAALVPALLSARPTRAPFVAALVHCASSASAALGPVLGGLASWAVGFEWTLRGLCVANVAQAVYLYRALRRHPLTAQWGATGTEDSDSDSEAEGKAVAEEKTELQPLEPRQYTPLR